MQKARSQWDKHIMRYGYEGTREANGVPNMLSGKIEEIETRFLC